VASGCQRTPEGAREALRRYEEQNSDLPVQTRRMLGLAALGRYFGRRNLEAALDQTLPRFPFRDWSWRWWNVLLHSGLERHWDEFALRAQRGGAREAATFLRAHTSRRAYALFLRRAGTNPHNDHRPKRGNIIWTKGGCWRRDSNWTRLLVLHEHLPERTLNRWQRMLGHENVRLIERELMHLIDSDTMLRHEAIDRAVHYVQRRVPEVLGWPKQRALGPKGLAWFFQTRVRTKIGTVVPLAQGGYVTRRARRLLWTW